MDEVSNASDERTRSNLMGRLSALVDRCIAPSVVAEGAEDLRRLRIAVVVLLLNAVLAPPGIVFQAMTDLRSAAMSALMWLVTIAALVVARRGGSARAVGHMLGALGILPPILDAGRTGILLSPPVGLVVVPVVVVLVAGARVGSLWCAVSVLGFQIMASFTTGFEPLLAQQWAIALSIATTILVALAYIVDRLRMQTQREISQARDEAREAAEIRSRFMANMSHEIRTPMNGVLGMLELVLETRLSSDQREHLEIARSSGQNLLELLTDTLDVSKLEAGLMTLKVARFDLRELAEETLDQMASLAATKDVELMLRYLPGTPRQVRGDRKRIRQVLVNLVSNAVKFTSEGHVLVSVRHEAEGEQTFEISVEDTGIGIPEDLQETIFEHFQQADASMVRAHTGTGLGLAIARELMALMGGTLGLRSREGEGSTFTLRCKLPAEEYEERPSSGLIGTRALVVSTHDRLRELLREQLESLGLVVVEEVTDQKAMHRLRGATEDGEPIRVVLVDHRPPRLDGITLSRWIEDDARLQGAAPVLLHSRTDTAVKDVEGIVRLVRPVRVTELVDSLTKATQDERVGSTEEATWTPAETPSTKEGPRVLVVEDNAINQKVITRMLTGLGCRVDVAASGVEALECTESQTYELVFMDVQMPKMDGLEATRRIRDRGGSSTELPIVALTAHAMAEDRERCLEAGMDRYLSKPVQRSGLLGVLREYGLA